jgi:hypothetical protein
MKKLTLCLEKVVKGLRPLRCDETGKRRRKRINEKIPPGGGETLKVVGEKFDGFAEKLAPATLTPTLRPGLPDGIF